MEAKELKLPNYNNCLACDAFIQINIAPQHVITEKDFDRMYSVKHEEKEFYMKLVDIKLLTYDELNVCSHMTLPATGLEAHEWRAWWMEKHPTTKPDTKMAVYYYKKHKE